MLCCVNNVANISVYKFVGANSYSSPCFVDFGLFSCSSFGLLLAFCVEDCWHCTNHLVICLVLFKVNFNKLFLPRVSVKFLIG